MDCSNTYKSEFSYYFYIIFAESRWKWSLLADAQLVIDTFYMHYGLFQTVLL